MFYEYNQNNSGGSFELDEAAGISHYVIIEADDAVEADYRAERIGLYFDDDYSIDCPCCGARWSPAWGTGDAVPNIYGREIVDGKIAPAKDEKSWSSTKWMKGPEGYIHYKDGSVVAFDY